MTEKPYLLELKKSWENTIRLDEDVKDYQEQVNSMLAAIFSPSGPRPINAVAFSRLNEKLIVKLDLISSTYHYLQTMLEKYYPEVFVK